MGNRTSRTTNGDTTKDEKAQEPGNSTRDKPTIFISKEKLTYMIREVIEHYRVKYKYERSDVEWLYKIFDEEIDTISLCARGLAEIKDRQSIDVEDVELALLLTFTSHMATKLLESVKQFLMREG